VRQREYIIKKRRESRDAAQKKSHGHRASLTQQSVQENGGKSERMLRKQLQMSYLLSFYKSQYRRGRVKIKEIIIKKKLGGKKPPNISAGKKERKK